MLDNILSDIVVLDFGQLIAGPVCGMWLADMGATVIKVEPPDGELARQLGPPWQNGESVAALTSNRNKFGLSIDLKHPLARDAIYRIAAKADVVLENFRPGVTARLKIDFDTLKHLKPDLIYCSVSAYGQDSPWKERPGVDGIIQAVSGIMSGIGAEDGEPGKVPLPLADMVGALTATLAILGALRRRDRHGEGGRLDISLYGAMLMLQQLNIASYLSTGELPVPTGSAAPYAAPNEAFPASDGWIMVAAYQDRRWIRFCEVVGLADLQADPRFATNRLRVANRPALREVLFPVFRQRRAADWCAAFNQTDILAAPVSTYADVVRSEPYAGSGIEITIDHAIAGAFKMPGFAIGSSRAAAPRRPPPRIGEHSRDLLLRFGFTEHEVSRLIAERVVIEGTHP